jgi:Ca-activated chloride channel family protein
MKTHVLLAALALLGSAPDLGAPGASPPTLLLAGRITDPASTPLAGAAVSLPSEGINGVSGRDGRYLLRLPDELAGREIELRVVLAGYAPARKTMVLGARGNVLDFVLSPTPSALEEGLGGASPSADVSARGAPLAASAGRFLARSIAPSPHPHRPPWPPIPGRYDPRFDTESYDHVVENPFLAVGANPLSTFSIDVDRASYANVRRFLREGRLPPPDAVRIEELVNYFRYRDAAPGPGEAPFRVTTEVAPAPWQPLHRLVRIGIKAREVELEHLPPANLVFLVDVSGSMQSPDKLPLLKTALGMLVDGLRPQDRVALVAYAGAAGLVLESTPGSERGRISEALDRLEAGGSTAGGAGLRLAYDVAARHHVAGGNNRVILATDGDFNVGPSSDGEMIRLIEEKREQGTFLTVLGFGTGNLKDSKMEKLADHGNGNFAYIDGVLEARKVLVSEMGGTLLTVAKDVKIQVEFNPAAVAGYRLIGYENRMLAAEDFEDDRKDAGELGAGHTVTALYEVVPAGVDGTVDLRGIGDLRYTDPGDVRRGAVASRELGFVKLRYKEPDGRRSRLLEHPVVEPETAGRRCFARGPESSACAPSEDFRFAAAVAAWGMLLRGSEHCDGFTFEDVALLARGALGEDEEGYRAEFLSLVRTSEALAHGPGLPGEGARPVR